MKKLILTLTLFSVSVSGLAHASPQLGVIEHPSVEATEAVGKASLASTLEDQLALLNANMNENQETAAGAEPSEMWFLQDIWIRLGIPVGVEVPGIAKVAFIPEIEILVQRPAPDGWANYKR